MTDDLAPEMINILSQYLDMLESNVEAEERYEHEDWFEGVYMLCIGVYMCVLILSYLDNEVDYVVSSYRL